MSGPRRESPRIEPPHPTTVAIEDESGVLVALGGVADFSMSGGCIWTDVLLPVGTEIQLRLSFAHPPELHALSARVAWTRCDKDDAWEHAYRSGVRWVDVGYTLGRRLRQLIQTAAPGPGADRYLFERHWVVGGQWSPQRLFGAGPVPGGERRRLARGDEGVTLPPGSRLWFGPVQSQVASPRMDEPPFPDSCPTCRALHQGRREFRWPVSSCSRCRHLRYGTPGVCGCQPRHSDSEPLERMLLAERTARRAPSARVAAGGPDLPIASGQ